MRVTVGADGDGAGQRNTEQPHARRVLTHLWSCDFQFPWAKFQPCEDCVPLVSHG